MACTDEPLEPSIDIRLVESLLGVRGKYRVLPIRLSILSYSRKAPLRFSSASLRYVAEMSLINVARLAYPRASA